MRLIWTLLVVVALVVMIAPLGKAMLVSASNVFPDCRLSYADEDTTFQKCSCNGLEVVVEDHLKDGGNLRSTCFGSIESKTCYSPATDEESECLF